MIAKIANKRISQVYEQAKKISFDNNSKIAIISDCHRGDGSWADNFAKNQNLYFSALKHYYYNGFIYIELGDGDELWENKKFSDIVTVHSNVFWLMSKFYKEKRIHLIYGNHDMVKKKQKWVRENLSFYYDEREKKYLPLFPKIKLHEGIILKHKETKKEIFLLHGHQADFLNDMLWVLSRFLVRYLWRPLELYGVNNPTSPAINHERKKKVEQRLYNWAKKQNQMMIAGHTHKPVYPENEPPLYFNDGSCVHPRCITAMEIVQGKLSLVKWHVDTKDDGTLFVTKEVLVGPREI